MTTTISRVKGPVIRQGWLRALVFFLAYIGCIFLGSLLAGMVIGVSAATQPGTQQPSLYSRMVTGMVLINALLPIGLVILFRLLIDRRSLMSLGFDWRGREAATGLLLGPALLGIGSLVLYWTGNLRWTDAVFNGPDLFIGVGLMFIAAVGEEVVFRGYLFNNLMGSYKPMVALGISALLFSLMHTGNTGINAVAVINLVLGGLLLGINYLYTKNLWFSIFLHFSWNFFQGPILGYQVSGLGLQSLLQMELHGPALLTGDHFGFEGSIIDTTVSLIAVILLWWRFSKVDRLTS